MGRNSSKPDIDEFISRYDVRCRDDVNNLTYLTDRRTSKNYMLKQLFANDETSIKNIESELIRKKQLHHEHVAQLKDYFIDLREQFCSRVYSSGALYQVPFRTLEDQRNDRSKAHTGFQQNELWSILASSILAFAYLQKNFIQHQSVRTPNMFIEDSGTIKICDPFAKQLPTNYQVFRQTRHSPGIYLSPSELRSYRQQNKYPIHNSYKSDVFVMGVVILQLAFLALQDQLYSKNKGLLNQALLAEQFERLRRKYGDELTKLIQKMMDMNQNTRMDWVGLEMYVRKQDAASLAKGEAGSTVQDKPSTAENTKKSNQTFNANNSGMFKNSTEKLNLRKDQKQKLLQVPPPTISPFHAIQVSSIPSIVSKPAPRTVRVSQPPLRDPNDLWGLPQNSRPPTQYQPTNVIFSHPLLANSPQITRASNPNFHSQQMVQQHIIMQNRGLSPMPMAKVKHHSEQQSFSGRTQDEGIEGYRQMVMQMAPSIRKVHYQQKLQISEPHTVSNSPVKVPQPTHKVSISGTVPQKQQKSKTNLQTCSKFNIKLETMQLSKLDMISQSTTLPQGVYEFRTKPDQNTVTSGQGTQPNKYEHSFLSQKQLKARPQQLPQQQPLLQPADLAKDPFGKKNSQGQLKKFKDHQSHLPLSPPAGTKSTIEPPVKLQYVKETYRQGSRYEGEKYKGMRHGKGKFYYDDGGMYDGSWNMNRMEGSGKLYYVNGKLAYQGNWVKDHFNGKGKLYNDNPSSIDRFDYRNFDDVQDYWKTYEGQFSNDLKHGKGVLLMQNGEKYQGTFKDDLVHGQGIFKGKDGTIRGLWDSNHLIKILK